MLVSDVAPGKQAHAKGQKTEEGEKRERIKQRHAREEEKRNECTHTIHAATVLPML